MVFEMREVSPFLARMSVALNCFLSLLFQITDRKGASSLVALLKCDVQELVKEVIYIYVYVRI